MARALLSFLHVANGGHSGQGGIEKGLPLQTHSGNQSGAPLDSKRGCSRKPWKQQAGSGLPDSRAAKEARAASSVSVLKQKKTPNKPKRGRQNTQEQQDPWSGIPSCVCPVKLNVPKGKGCLSSCPQLPPEIPAWLPFIVIAPEPWRMGAGAGTATTLRTKKSRSKPPKMVWDNNLSPRHSLF